jgi:hypothetical protein
MSVSEPFMAHRKTLKDAVKTEVDRLPQDKPEGYLFTFQAAAAV